MSVRRSLRPYLLDIIGWLLTALLASTGAAFLQDHYALPDMPVPWVWFGVLGALPAGLARRTPIVAASVATVGIALFAVFSDPTGHDQPWPWPAASGIAMLVAVLSGALSLRLWAAVACAIAPNIIGVSVVTHSANTPTGVLFASVSLAILLFGRLVVANRARRSATDERDKVRAQAQVDRQIVNDRAQIARELHDVVAHHMSIISVQASSAPYRLDGMDPATKDEFETIAQSARSSMSEMRRLLNVLRSGSVTAERHPMPGLVDIEELANATRRVGVPVRLDLPKRLDEVPPLVALTAYRIVQESLSNVVRHAPGAATDVGIVAGAETIDVRVINAPAVHGATDTVRMVEPNRTSVVVGQGIRGMTERAKAIGGTLEAECTTEGGFMVNAVLPVVASERTVGA